MNRRRADRPTREEILAMEISEDKRLREVGIDPNGDPLDIMKQVRVRYEAWEAEERLTKAEEEKDVAEHSFNPREKPLNG